MLHRLKRYGTIAGENLLWLSLSALNFSTALSSIFFGFWVLHSLYFDRYKKIATQDSAQASDSMPKPLMQRNTSLLFFGLLGLGVFMSVCLSSVWNGGFFSPFLNYIQVKLPLLLLLIGFVFRMKIAKRNPWAWVFYLLPNFWIVTASCIHYLQHFQFYSAMVLESKPIPMFTQIYHIEYGAMVAISGLMFLEDWWTNNLGTSNRKMILGIAAVTVMGLHVLALRTGLVMFYTGLVGLVFFRFRSERLALDFKNVLQHKYRWRIVLVALVCFVGFLFLPSVQHRIKNTVSDIATIVRGGDTNHKSLGQRVEAWSAAVSAIKHNPWGVGVAGEFDAMMQGYDDTHSQLSMAHRIGIHNQFLQLGVQGGWLAMWMAIGWLLFGIVRFPGGFWLIVLISGLLVESFFERQAGILITVVTLLNSVYESYGKSLEEEKIE